MEGGFITIHRKITEWEWYTDENTMRLFIHLLLKANHKEQKWRGQTIERGQLITGRKVLAQELKLGERQIRTALTHLKSTNEVTIKSTNHFSLITLVNYDFYQTKKDRATNKTTSKRSSDRPATDQQPTTNNNDNNDNNVNNKYKAVYDYYISLDLVQHKKYTKQMTEAIKKAEDNLKVDFEEMKRMLKRHEEKVKSSKSTEYKTKVRTLSEFFGQKKYKSTDLICSDYLDERYENEPLSNESKLARIKAEIEKRKNG